MTEAKLEKLYLKVMERRGIEMPLRDFEAEFASLKPKALAGAPKHCTVVVSLWGLQTKYPEAMLSKDIVEAVRLLRSADEILIPFRNKEHQNLIENRNVIAKAIRTKEFASRTCLLACFNLTEATLNGLAWEFSQDSNAFGALSQRQQKLINDGEFRSKLLKYPEIISGQPLWDNNDERVRAFLDHVKHYRDALVHASPFSTPQKYGGLDKLEFIYRIDSGKALEAASQTVCLLTDLLRHVLGKQQPLPAWLEHLEMETASNEELPD